MTATAPVRAYAGTGAVDVRTYERLAAIGQRWGWLPMLSDHGELGARAFLRRTESTYPGAPTRLYGRWAPTPQGAVEALLARVEPMAREAAR